MMISKFRHDYFLFADDILVTVLHRMPLTSDFLFVSRVLDIPLDRIYAKYKCCNFELVFD